MKKGNLGIEEEMNKEIEGKAKQRQRRDKEKPLKAETQARAEHAYQIYKALGDKRTQVAVAEKLGIGRSTIGQWAMVYKWADRLAEEYRADAEEIAEKTRTNKEEWLEMIQRGIQKWADSVAKDEVTVYTKDAIELMKYAEKLAGDMREGEEVEGFTLDLTGMPGDERKEKEEKEEGKADEVKP